MEAGDFNFKILYQLVWKFKIFMILPRCKMIRIWMLELYMVVTVINFVAFGSPIPGFKYLWLAI